MSKDRSKEILREIKDLRKELGDRIERLESAAGLSRSEGASVHETEVADVSPRDVTDPTPAAALPGTSAVSPIGSVGSPRSLSVVVRPLLDLSLARAVEASLRETEGIESARLSSLSGDSAVIDAKVRPGVSVISTLRQSLPVAFDVTESTDDSVTIELARPETDEPGTGAASQEAGA